MASARHEPTVNRSSLYDRFHPGVASRPASLPMVSPYSGAASSRPSRSATRPVAVGTNPFTSQTAGMRVFKKCKSATFQIDGHTYTIGKYYLPFLPFPFSSPTEQKGFAPVSEGDYKFVVLSEVVRSENFFPSGGNVRTEEQRQFAVAALSKVSARKSALERLSSPGPRDKLPRRH
uniref:Uncharacterized protein n=1 Tax=Anopheles melas TaxID=34690 RepID=A0A182TJV4_9DIPT